MDGTKPPSSELGSWKEIAQYLRVTVRTPQKWGAVRGLPVKRAAGQKGRDWATTEELDQWWGKRSSGRTSGPTSP
jgi:hypothetical protein